MVPRIKSTPEIFKRVQDRTKEMKISLAKLIEIVGSTSSQIHRMRTGGTITLKYWERVAKGLDVKTDWLLYGPMPVQEGESDALDYLLLCVVVGCDKIQARGKYCFKHSKLVGIKVQENMLKVDPAPIFDDKGEFSAKDTPALVFKKVSDVYRKAFITLCEECHEQEKSR